MSRPWEIPYEKRFAGRLPRIQIGIISFDAVSPEAAESLAYWCFHQGKTLNGKFEICLDFSVRREQYRARNGIVEIAQRNQADFLLVADDDHTLFDCPDMIKYFWEEAKPLQGGLYVQRREDRLQPVIQRYDANRDACYWCTWDEVPKHGGPVDVLGGGLNWIDMSLFDFIREPFWWPYPYDHEDGRAVKHVSFYPQLRFGLDLQFCLAAKRIGVQPWLNGNVQVGHVVAEHRVVRPDGMRPHRVCHECDSVAPYVKDEGYVCQNCGARL